MSAEPYAEPHRAEVPDRGRIKSPLTSPAEPLFGVRPLEPSPRPILPWIVAGIAMLVIAAGLLLMGHRKPLGSANDVLPPDPYASNLVFTDLQMSESTSLSGGKSTFIDGHVRNTGNHTVMSASLQVLFGNDEALPPQVDTLPLTVIRTRQPYVDTQLLNVSPLAPGQDQEFRLIFENIGTNWNQRLPKIQVVLTKLR